MVMTMPSSPNKTVDSAAGHYVMSVNEDRGNDDHRHGDYYDDDGNDGELDGDGEYDDKVDEYNLRLGNIPFLHQLLVRVNNKSHNHLQNIHNNKTIAATITITSLTTSCMIFTMTITMMIL